MFGQVAAANALSDIYTMGAVPVTALNLVAYPVCKLGADTLKAILPDQLITNSGAAPGDILVLTKPIGTGVLATALKGGLLSEAEEKALAEQMAELNAAAAQVMREVGVNACTDITGFGLLGHMREMAANSGVDMELDPSKVPFLPRAKELAEEGLVPGGAYRNREHFGQYVEISGELPTVISDLLFDPQTSGGLLMAVPAEKSQQLLEGLHNSGVTASPVGRVLSSGQGKILIRES